MLPQSSIVLTASAGARAAEPPVERAQRGALLGADREMQGITGAQAERVLIDEPGRQPELRA